eukprot:GHVO01003604.1.p1 GENE.GHVO01003604.1~~GHVO01003604.1.p1  ORF type:complete len:458 (-),score=46.09 GHVO01003604.1:17-1390(-)
MLKLLIFAALGLGTLYLLGVFSPTPPRPEVKAEGWYGRGSKKSKDDESIKPFRVNVPQKDLDDLDSRLKNVRLGEDLEESTFEYGFQVGFMKTVIDHWRKKFNWRKQEALLNSFPQFTTKIEGIDVHFIRVKPASQSKGPAKPLLMVHGWPGSIWEFYKILPMLTDPENNGFAGNEAFEVICPSIPGYGFSEAPHHRGFNTRETARLFVKLMKRLGHEKFYLQGGDWGSGITTDIATMYPQNSIALHLNMMLTLSPNPLKQIALALMPSLFLEDGEQYLGFLGQFGLLLKETGYMHLQATRPDSVAFSLNDSPVGLAAYLMEKFAVWTDQESLKTKDGDLTKHFTMDELLTNVMIYWVSGCIGPSMRYYRENIYDLTEALPWAKVPVEAPVGLAAFKHELYNSPIFLMKNKFPNVVQHSVLPHGGHFAALQVPEVLARDFFSFVKKINQRKSGKNEL